MEESDLRKAARTTGYWTEGVIRGTLKAGPPLMVLALLIGVTLRLVRQGMQVGGLD